MNGDTLTSTERIMKTVGGEDVDRIPFILTLTHHGAKELGVSIEEYYHSPEKVVRGQLILHKKYQDDALMGANYFAMEIEPFGGEVIFFKDGPPNTGRPPIRDIEIINSLEVPKYDHILSYQNTLDIIRGLKAQVGTEIPIVGGILSPFSIPIVQMGFDRYFELLYRNPDEFNRLMRVNIDYATKWANDQLNAGATFIVYFDPLASTEMIPRKLFLEKGLPVARKVSQAIDGPIGYHFASGAATNTFGDVATLNPVAIGISSKDNIIELHQKFPSRPCILGNLSGINMVNWTQEEAESIVQTILIQGKSSGKFILSDNHGEIPYAVKDETLFGISRAIDRFGRFN